MAAINADLAKQTRKTPGMSTADSAPEPRTRHPSGSDMQTSRAYEKASRHAEAGGGTKNHSEAEGSLQRRNESKTRSKAGATHTSVGAGSNLRAEAGASSKDGSRRSGASTRSGPRKRTLIQAYSEDEDEIAAIPTNQPTTFKGHTTPYHDADIDMQLEDVSPEHGGSSLQISTSQDEYLAIPNQAANSTAQLDIINLAEATPPPNPHQNSRMETTNDTQSAKRRRGEGGSHTLNSSTNNPQPTRAKEAIPSIDIASQIWLGFPIHEAIASHKGMAIIQEHRTHDEFIKLGTPPREIIDFKTIRRAFPRVPQLCYPSERPDAVPGSHLHFTQVPRQERVNPTTGLSEDFTITIRFDHGYKGMSRQDARGACIERLRLMDIPLGTVYSNPIDIRLNAVTKTWAGFIKVHLQNPTLDGMALFNGNRAFVMTMVDGERVIGKIEKGYELGTKARNLRVHLKGEILRHVEAFIIFESLVQESYYMGHQHEFMGLTKPEFDRNFAFLTFTTEEARNIVLKEGLTYNNERLQVSIPRDRGVGNPSELRISTTLVANHLPQRET